jgi:hypothetical protein
MSGSKRAIVIGFFCLGVAALGYFVLTRGLRAHGPAVVQRELAMRIMGEYLAEYFPNQKVLVLSNPFTQEAGRPNQVYAFEAAAVRGLRQGMGKLLTLQAVVFPELRPEALHDPSSVLVDPKTTTPLSFLTKEDAWLQLIRSYPETDVVVSLIGLPANLSKLDAWQTPSKPAFALLLPDLSFAGGPSEVRNAFQLGKIAAAILNKPDAPPENEPPGSSPQAEFDRRFVLLTGKNFDQLTNQYPVLIRSALRLD